MASRIQAGRIARSAGQPQREGPRSAAREFDPAVANLGEDLLALSQARRWQSLPFLPISGPHDGLDVECELGAIVTIERHEAARLVVKNNDSFLDRQGHVAPGHLTSEKEPDARREQDGDDYRWQPKGAGHAVAPFASGGVILIPAQRSNLLARTATGPRRATSRTLPLRLHWKGSGDMEGSRPDGDDQAQLSQAV
jgi:hypothetical protein